MLLEILIAFVGGLTNLLSNNGDGIINTGLKFCQWSLHNNPTGGTLLYHYLLVPICLVMTYFMYYIIQLIGSSLFKWVMKLFLYLTAIMVVGQMVYLLNQEYHVSTCYCMEQMNYHQTPNKIVSLNVTNAFTNFIRDVLKMIRSLIYTFFPSMQMLDEFDAKRNMFTGKEISYEEYLTSLPEQQSYCDLLFGSTVFKKVHVDESSNIYSIQMMISLSYEISSLVMCAANKLMIQLMTVHQKI